MRKPKLLLFSFLIIFAIGIYFLFFFSTKKENYHSRVYFPKKDISLNVSLARSSSEWSRGLMFKKSLPENEGMLFVFPDEIPRQFWMKNMIFPLDVIFVSTDKKIADIKENFAPCASENCPSYQSPKIAKYVLEAQGGFAAKNGLKIGDIIEFSHF